MQGLSIITSIRARLEEKIVGGEEALATARHMFQVLKDLTSLKICTTSRHKHAFHDFKSKVAFCFMA